MAVRFRIRAAVDAIIITCWIILNAICVACGLQGVRIASGSVAATLSFLMLGWVFIVAGASFIANLLHRLDPGCC